MLATLAFIATTTGATTRADAQPPSVVVVQPIQSGYTDPQGRYELRGEGTATSPHYWVWIPAGAVSYAPAVQDGEPDLLSADGEVAEVDSWGRSITLNDDQEFEVPDSVSVSNRPRSGRTSSSRTM